MILLSRRPEGPSRPDERMTFRHAFRALFELAACSIAPRWCNKRWTR